MSKFISLLVGLFALPFAGCETLAVDADPGRTEVSRSAIELRVMTFNIEWGGDNIDFDNVIEAIRKSRADIVGIQEPLGNLGRLATALNWYSDELTYVISKYPLLTPPAANGYYVFAEVSPDKVVAVANVHLPSDPDGMGMVRDGATAAEVLAIERATRLPKIQPYLGMLEPLIQRGMPVYLSGDFNAPAHTDWTAETVGDRPFLRYPLTWPVSFVTAEAGLRDSYREIYPDPKLNPGLTWWARRPPLELYSPNENDPEERIDFLWHAGSSTTISSEIVGEKNFPGVTISVEPWPSDHRGVVSLFSVLPADVPPLVSSRRRVHRIGDEIEISYRQAANSRIRITRYGEKQNSILVTEEKLSGSGQLTFATNDLPAGRYIATMSAPLRQNVNCEFWILQKNAVPDVSLAGTEFNAGESIGVSWRNGPGYRNDYLSVVKVGSDSDYSGGSAWLYINALPAGRINLDASTVAAGWPIEPGNYVVRLIEDDGREVLAESAPFIIH
ncbi:MAG: endonuclease/exonuclease/phosphatase family protein [Gammaproteobacteria bacterium]|nr:endonuclease/exonuclease/phosphatase family protein [Gammaproteobacteria bacterium]